MKMLNSDPTDNRVVLNNEKIVNLDDFEDEWHPAHPNDELPPQRTKKLKPLKEKLNKEASQGGL